VVVAAPAPESVTVAPLPIADGLIVPDIVVVCAVKLTAVALLPAIVIDWLGGVNVTPLLAGVTV
jgi:hypothetical protein